MDKDKLLLAIAGAVAGWILKAISDHFSRESTSWYALDRLEYELAAVYVLVNQAKEWMSREGETSTESGHAKSNSRKIIASLKPIASLDTHFGEISRRLKNDELQMAVGTVLTYNTMRAIQSEEIPDLSTFPILSRVLDSRRFLTGPFIWLQHPLAALRQSRKATQEMTHFEGLQQVSEFRRWRDGLRAKSAPELGE